MDYMGLCCTLSLLWVYIWKIVSVVAEEKRVQQTLPLLSMLSCTFIHMDVQVTVDQAWGYRVLDRAGPCSEEQPRADKMYVNNNIIY